MTFSYKMHRRVEAGKEKTHPLLHEAVRVGAIIIGAILVGVGLEYFLVPNGFLDGGITGVSIILTHYFKLPLGVFIALVNLPFVILSFKHLGKKASLKTAIGIASLVLSTLLIGHVKPATEEFTLALGYGGLLVGAGVGLALKFGGALDGTEALAVILSQRMRANVDQIILAINLVIFAFAAAFISPQAAMSSLLLYYVVVTPMIKKVMEGGSEIKTAQVITTEYRDVVKTIHDTINRRVVITGAHRTSGSEVDGEDGNNVKVLTLIVSRIEENLLQDAVEEVDPDAIIIFNDSATIHGGIIQRSKHH